MPELDIPQIKIDLLIVLLGYFVFLGVVGLVYVWAPWRQFTPWQSHDEKPD